MDVLSQEYTFNLFSQNMLNLQICYLCASTLIHIGFIWPIILHSVGGMPNPIRS